MGGRRLLGWIIGRVVLAWDVPCVEFDACSLAFIMYQLEDLICGSVAAPSFPPAFDNTLVVTKDLDICA